MEYGVSSRTDSATLGLIYSVKGIVNRRLQKYEDALNNVDKAIQINQAFGDSVRVAISKGNKAVIFYETGDFAAAEPLLRNDYITSLKNGVKSSAFNAGITLCNIYLENDEPQKLDTLFSKISSMKENEEINFNNRQLLAYYKLAADVFENEENDSLSKEYLTKYISIDKKIDSIKKINDVGRLQEKYLMEKEITKLELLQKTNELQASHLKLRTALLFIIGFAFLVVLWYVYVLRHKNRKIDRLNEMLEAKVSERTTRLLEINKELDNYLYRASHDIRRPIRTLLGLNNVMKFTDDPSELKMLFTKVHDTAMNMDEMLFKLQMAYELNNNHSLETVQVEEVINDSIRDQKRLIDYKQAEIHIKISEKAKELRANAALIKIAIDNMLENALIYHNEDVRPEIEITTDIGKYFFYIHIQDNGYGIDENYHEKVFESYFKISNKTQGSGLGLFLAHRAITYLAGEIAIESVINEGTKFTIKLPINPR
jgi:signal transduction histidine kinase